jgi:hypothetical protein
MRWSLLERDGGSSDRSRIQRIRFPGTSARTASRHRELRLLQRCRRVVPRSWPVSSITHNAPRSPPVRGAAQPIARALPTLMFWESLDAQVIAIGGDQCVGVCAGVSVHAIDERAVRQSSWPRVSSSKTGRCFWLRCRQHRPGQRPLRGIPVMSHNCMGGQFSDQAIEVGRAANCLPPLSGQFGSKVSRCGRGGVGVQPRRDPPVPTLPAGPGPAAQSLTGGCPCARRHLLTADRDKASRSFDQGRSAVTWMPNSAAAGLASTVITTKCLEAA